MLYISQRPKCNCLLVIVFWCVGNSMLYETCTAAWQGTSLSACWERATCLLRSSYVYGIAQLNCITVLITAPACVAMVLVLLQCMLFVSCIWCMSICIMRLVYVYVHNVSGVLYATAARCYMSICITRLVCVVCYCLQVSGLKPGHEYEVQVKRDGRITSAHPAIRKVW